MEQQPHGRPAAGGQEPACIRSAMVVLLVLLIASLTAFSAMLAILASASDNLPAAATTELHR